MTRRRGTRLLGFGAATIVAALAITACAGTGYNYVKSSEQKTYFKVPDGWKVYSQQDILDKAGKKLSQSEKQSQLDNTWRVVFDASPKPALSHLLDAKAKSPTGMALVLQLSFNDSDTLSLKDLRNFFFDVDTATQNNKGEVLTYEDLELDGGFHGIHLVATVQDSNGRPITFNEKAVLDKSTSKVYFLVVGCQTTCYEDNQTQIENVVDSWTVRE